MASSIQTQKASSKITPQEEAEDLPMVDLSLGDKTSKESHPDEIITLSKSAHKASSNYKSTEENPEVLKPLLVGDHDEVTNDGEGPSRTSQSEINIESGPEPIQKTVLWFRTLFTRCVVPLTVFFVFSFLVPAFDIYSDIWTGLELIKKGHLWWGSLTLTLVMTPYIGEIAISIFTHVKVIKNDINMSNAEKLSKIFICNWSMVKFLVLHFPVFLPLRNLRLFIGLFLMDISLIQNDLLIRSIHNKVSTSGIYETFLESAPQFVLQCSIILRTGNYGNSHLWSIPSSFVALTLSSSKLFYHLRLGRFSEPRPTFKMLFVVSPFIAVLNLGYMSSLILIAAYWRYGVIIFVLVVGLLAFVSLLMFRNKNKKDMEELYDPKYNNIFQKDYDLLTWSTIFTASFSPCSVWSNNISKKSNIPFIIRSVVTVSHIIALIILTFAYPSNDALLEEVNPPILHCFSDADHFNSSSGYRFVTLDSNSSIFSIFQNLDEDNSLPAIKICSGHELPYMFPGLVGMLLTLSCLSSWFLYWLGDYNHLYKFTKRISFYFSWFEPIIHHSLLQDLIINEEEEKFKKLFEQHEKVCKELIFKNDTITGENCFYLVNFNLLTFLFSILNSKELSLGFASPDFEKRFKWYISTIATQKNRESMENKFKDAKKQIGVKSYFQLWNESLMHRYAKENGFVKLCLLNILGGHWSNKNENNEDVLDVILSQIQNDSEIFEHSLPVTKYFITKAIGSDNKTFNHYAAKFGNFTIIQKNVDINAKNINGETPLHLAAMFGQVESIEKLIQLNADVNAKNNNGETPLHVAAMTGQVDSIEKLIQLNADVNAKDNDGDTPLHYAAETGEVESIEKLIQFKADVNAKDNDEATPLHFAAEFGQVESIEKLIELNADVNAKNNDGETPLHYAASDGQVESIEKLIQLNADVNATNNYGHTPLHYAAGKGQVESIEKLIQLNADVSAKDNDGYTPLHYAASDGQVETIEKLIQLNADVNAKNNDGHTPLHFAAGCGQVESIEKLIQLKADVNAKDNDGDTPLDIAVQEKHENAIKLLTDYQTNL